MPVIINFVLLFQIQWRDFSQTIPTLIQNICLQLKKERGSLLSHCRCFDILREDSLQIEKSLDKSDQDVVSFSSCSES